MQRTPAFQPPEIPNGGVCQNALQTVARNALFAFTILSAVKHLSHGSDAAVSGVTGSCEVRVDCSVGTSGVPKPI